MINRHGRRVFRAPDAVSRRTVRVPSGERGHIMTKAEANVRIRIAGAFGLCAVIFSLISATFRLPGTPISVSSGLTPLMGLELVHNKAELAAALGPMGSKNREMIARRNPAPGRDLVGSFILFLLAVFKLTRR